MTSETVRHVPDIIPYHMDLPENFVCPNPESRAEGMLQADTISEPHYLLRNHFSHRNDVLVDTGGFVFYQRGDMNVRQRPDVYLAFGVDEIAIRRRNGYVVWEAGKPPDFVLEVASESTRQVDTDTKPVIYSRMGVSEYWRFDPTGGDLYGYALAGDMLVNGVYQPIPVATESDGEVWGYSPALDLSLCALHPEWKERLRFYDRTTGRYLRNFDEEQAARREAEAEIERLWAENRRLRGQ